MGSEIAFSLDFRFPYNNDPHSRNVLYMVFDDCVAYFRCQSKNKLKDFFCSFNFSRSF